eukprot:5517062-Amphidinium_carterae.1
MKKASPRKCNGAVEGRYITEVVVTCDGEVEVEVDKQPVCRFVFWPRFLEIASVYEFGCATSVLVALIFQVLMWWDGSEVVNEWFGAQQQASVERSAAQWPSRLVEVIHIGVDLYDDVDGD